MNRYTYKAKRKDNSEWVYGFLTFDNYDAYICTSLYGDGWEVCDLKTICQCTGVKDIEGNYIFENDIIKYLDYICEVKYKNGGFYLDTGKGIFFFYDMANVMLEIIGNKFDEVIR